MADYTDVQARVPFNYNKMNRDRGEVFKLIGARNDEKLIGLRFVLPYDLKSKLTHCDTCGRNFIAPGFYEAHKKKKDCNDEQGDLTRLETAELIGADPDKLVIEKDDVVQRATDFTGAI